MSDLISRQAVQDYIAKYLSQYLYIIDIATEDGAYDYVSAQEIANAPSVNPQPKTGHWIKTSSGFKCSKCLIVHSHTSLFCQSCGAKMNESQERSDKE